jgi:Arc/MetJ-type ribon-helix-helix transcriptional regulator
VANRDFEMEMRMKADFQSADRASERTVDNIRKISDATAQANAEMGALGSDVGTGAGDGIAQQTAATDNLTASLGRNAEARRAVQQASRATQQAVAAEMGLIRDLQERLEAGAGSFEDLADTEQMLDRAMSRGLISAEEYDEALGKLNDEQARLTREGEKSGKAIDTTIGRYDKASAGLKRLQADEARLKDAVDRGRISREAYNRAMAGIADERTRLLAIRDGANQAANGMRTLNLSTRETQRNLSQLVTYGVTGQWQLAGSQLIQLGNGAGIAGSLASGAGVAIGGLALAVSGLTAALAINYLQERAFDTALISTGRIAGVTTGQLSQMRNEIGEATDNYAAAQTSLEALAGSGRLAGGALESAATAAVNLSELTGRSIEDTTNRIIALAKSPTEGLVELNDQYHFLTLEVYENVKSLEAQGRTQDAVKAATDALANATAQRVEEMRANAGSLERAWYAVRGAVRSTWQAIKDIGREDAEARIAAGQRGILMANQRRAELKEDVRLGILTQAQADRANETLRQRIALEQKNIAQWQQKKDGEDQAARDRAENQKLQDDAVSAAAAIDRELARTDKRAERQQRLNTLIEQYNKIAAVNPNDDRLYDGSYERLKKAIEKETEEKKPKARADKKDEDPDRDALREVENLQKQVALLGELAEGQDKVSEAARIRYEIEDGAYKNASESVKQQLVDYAQLLDSERANVEAKKEAAKALEETKKAYEQVREALRTPAEIALEGAIDQVKVLNDALKSGVADKAAYDQAMGRVVTGAFAKPPEFEGLAPEVGGAQGEVGKTFKAQAELEKWYADQLALLQKFREQKIGVESQWNAQEQALTLQHQNALRQIESARQQAMLAAASATFGQLADIAKAYGGEQSKTYRALFALSKAFAIAQAAVALVNNVSEASKYGFPQNIPFIAGALAQGAQIASLLSNANFQGGGGYATGGHVRGPGTGTSDSINAQLSDYEYVTRSAVVRQPGALAFLEQFNKQGMSALHQWAQYADGGLATSGSTPSLAPPAWDKAPAANEGAFGGPTVALRNVVVLDPAELASAMTGGAGEKMVMTHVRANLPTIRQMVNKGGR